MIEKEKKNDIIPEILGNFFEKIEFEIKIYLDSENVSSFTGPTKRESKNNFTIAYNIYPDSEIVDKKFQHR